MVASALPIDTANRAAAALPAVVSGHKSKKRSKDKKTKKSKKQKRSSSSSSSSQSSTTSIAVASGPTDRKPMFYKRSALPNGSGTYRMLPIAVIKEILHVISPEMCTREGKNTLPLSSDVFLAGGISVPVHRFVDQ
jgi:hypothetical protein